MIPNLSPIIIALGVIGVTDIQLDLFTMMTGSIAIGLAVDDTIHFMHNFRRYHLDTGDVKLAVHQTLQSTGRAMLFTTLVLSTGFFIMIFVRWRILMRRLGTGLRLSILLWATGESLSRTAASLLFVKL